jgi:hypothetical protein
VVAQFVATLEMQEDDHTSDASEDEEEPSHPQSPDNGDEAGVNKDVEAEFIQVCHTKHTHTHTHTYAQIHIAPHLCLCMDIAWIPVFVWPRHRHIAGVARAISDIMIFHVYVHIAHTLHV